MSERPALGFIGIGLMGRPMVLRLLDAGYRVTVWNRSRDRLAPVLARGAIAADSPAGVARAAGIVMLCVTDQHAVREVLFGRRPARRTHQRPAAAFEAADDADQRDDPLRAAAQRRTASSVFGTCCSGLIDEYA